MHVYRLDPVDSGLASWRHSQEKDTVWACAAGEQEARALASARSGFDAAAPQDVPSPWKDPRAVSCTLDPTMGYPDPGQVMRADGSLVAF